jgi:hypothetical protein
MVDERLICFSTDGTFIREVSTVENIRALAIVNHVLMAGTNVSTIHEVDTSTGNALTSYYLPEGLIGDSMYGISGIAAFNGGFLAARGTYTSLTFYQFQFPE